MFIFHFVLLCFIVFVLPSGVIKNDDYKVSKSEVFEKVGPAADFCISADDIMPKIVKIAGCMLKL